MLAIDPHLLERFEAGLDPQHLVDSKVPGEIIGYGEISAIFRIRGDDRNVYKRLPVFDDRSSAQRYAAMHAEYCRLLGEAGLRLPASATHIVSIPGRPVILYIAQRELTGHHFCHRRIHHLNDADSLAQIEKAAAEIAKVWSFNREAAPAMELAIDGQLSNWAVANSDGCGPQLVYIDTSTPLMRINEVEQLDPELLLKSAPRALRWIIRRLFLADVMNRYYAPRLVYTDLTANLIKEQRPDLVAPAVAVVNRFLDKGNPPLTVREVEKYYGEDKLIWTIFLAFRRIDRWLAARLLNRRYEFILPGTIKR